MPLPDFDTLAPVETKSALPDFDSLKPVTPAPAPRFDTSKVQLDPYQKSYLATGTTDPSRDPSMTALDIVSGRGGSAESAANVYRAAAAAPGAIMETVPGGKYVNRALTYGGNVVRAIPADVAETYAGNEPYYELHNLAAAALGEPLPIDEKLKEASADAPTWATIGKISQGIAGTAPMAAIGNLPAAAQKLILAGFTAKMMSDAPKIATALGDELGKPKEQQDPDKVTSLVSEAVQIVGFSAAGAVGLKRAFATPEPGPIQGPPATGAFLQRPPGAMPEPPPDLGPIPGVPSRGLPAPAVPDPGRMLPRATVPGTPAEPRESSVETIRNAQAKTIRQIQDLFPKAELSREQARELRNLAWETPTTTPQQDYALHKKAEAVFRPVQQPAIPEEGARQVPPTEPGPPTGARGGTVPGTPPGEVALTPAAPETITAAAYRDKYGTVHTGANHPEILDRLGIKGYETDESRNTPQFGFATNKRPFITREEAGRIEGLKPSEPAHADEIESPTQPGVPLSETKPSAQPQTASATITALERQAATLRAAIEKGKAAPRLTQLQGQRIQKLQKLEARIAKEKARTPTSIKNAVVDQERAQRGLPPAIEPARRAFGTVWEQAMSRIDRDPASQDQLIAELQTKPRALTDTEDAMLLHRQIDLQNEYAKAARDLAQAYDDNRLDTVEEQKVRLARLSDQLFDIYEIGKHTGIETARGLNARKMLAYEDFTLAKMTLDKRVAKGGAPLTPDEQADIARQQKEIVEKQKAADDAIAQQQTRQQETADEEGIQVTIRRAKAEGAKRGPRPRDIGAEHNRIVKGLTKRLDEGEDITNLGNWIQKLARLFVEQGITERDPLIDAVHEVVQELVPEFSRRDTMDAISGYGDFKQLSKDEISVTLRDLKGQMQQVAKLQDIMAKQPPLKTGLERRAPSDEERRLIKLVNDAKRRFGIVITDPARQLQSALGARKTYYRNQIADLETQIANREKFIKERAPSPTDLELERLKAQRDEIKKQFDQMFPKPEKTNAELLAALKTRLQNRIADYQQRLAEKDFAPRPRRQITLDKEALRLQAEAGQAKELWQRGLIQDRLDQRPAFQKGMDKLVKWRQAFVISGIRSIFKLVSASIEGMVFLPAREIVGAGLARLPGIREIAARAPSEGGLNVRAEAKALTETWSHLLSDFTKNIRGEKPDFEQVYGPWRNLPPELQNYVGFLHGALKSPLARNVWTRSFAKRMEFSARHGEDISDPLVQMKNGQLAWEDSSFWRFQNRNLATSMYRQIIARLQAQGFLKTGTAIKLEFPVINVPTNIVARTFESVFGAVTGSYRAARALRAGIENLKPEQADLIMRNLKTGSLGAALTILGYLTADQVGGYYQPGKKQKPEAVKYGTIHMWGTDIPAYLLHNPFLEAVQFGATIRHVADARMKKTNAETNGLWMGLAQATTGAYEQLPFIRESVDLSGLRQPTQMRNVVGEHLRSFVIPMALQWIAEQTDKGVQRQPQTISQHLEMGIPGLRQNVPLKKAKPGPAAAP